MNELDFSTLTVEDLPVTGPNGEKFILRVADGEAGTRWRDWNMTHTKAGADGISALPVEGLAEAAPILVAGCLFRVVEGKEPQKMTKEEVKKLPYKMINALFEKAKDISGLNDQSVNTLEKQRDAMNALIEKMKANEAAVKN